MALEIKATAVVLARFENDYSEFSVQNLFFVYSILCNRFRATEFRSSFSNIICFQKSCQLYSASE